MKVLTKDQAIQKRQRKKIKSLAERTRIPLSKLQNLIKFKANQNPSNSSPPQAPLTPTRPPLPPSPSRSKSSPSQRSPKFNQSHPAPPTPTKSSSVSPRYQSSKVCPVKKEPNNSKGSNLSQPSTSVEPKQERIYAENSDHESAKSSPEKSKLSEETLTPIKVVDAAKSLPASSKARKISIQDYKAKKEAEKKRKSQEGFEYSSGSDQNSCPNSGASSETASKEGSPEPAIAKAISSPKKEATDTSSNPETLPTITD